MHGVASGCCIDVSRAIRCPATGSTHGRPVAMRDRSTRNFGQKRWFRLLAALSVVGLLGCGGSTTPPAGAHAGTFSGVGAMVSSGAGAFAGLGGRAGTANGGGLASSAGSGVLPSAGSAGKSNVAGGGAAASGGAGSSDGAAGSGAAGPRFSFFLTSQAGLVRLSGNALGFGGDLRFGKADGLAGADEICRQLAETSMPSNGKTWRAFLSVSKGPDGKPLNAIDRIGAGPWYDRTGRVFAMNQAALRNTRPQGADPLIANDFPNEDGVPNHNPGTGVVDNHNTLTGSTAQGTLDSQGLQATCQDWTSSAPMTGKPRCGVSWPRGQLTHWISMLNEGGCVPGATPPGAEGGAQGTVGALGGYGGFYCFALTP